ncbi:hypothetical protein LOK49_LG12G02548, partial [Camellia lanceoleosa]
LLDKRYPTKGEAPVACLPDLKFVFLSNVGHALGVCLIKGYTKSNPDVDVVGAITGQDRLVLQGNLRRQRPQSSLLSAVLCLSTRSKGASLSCSLNSFLNTQDVQAEIGALKAENKELKRKTTSMARFGATSFLAFDTSVPTCRGGASPIWGNVILNHKMWLLQAKRKLKWRNLKEAEIQLYSDENKALGKLYHFDKGSRVEKWVDLEVVPLRHLLHPLFLAKKAKICSSDWLDYVNAFVPSASVPSPITEASTSSSPSSEIEASTPSSPPSGIETSTPSPSSEAEPSTPSPPPTLSWTEKLRLALP